MNIDEMKAVVDKIFSENPELETTLSKKEWVESEEILTILVYKIIRRTYSKLGKSRKKKLKTSDVSKIMLESMIEIVEEY